MIEKVPPVEQPEPTHNRKEYRDLNLDRNPKPPVEVEEESETDINSRIESLNQDGKKYA